MTKQAIHFIGIGGIGMSALARYFLAKNWQVSGSDLYNSEITESLQSEGIRIFIGQKPENISSHLELVVYSAAIKESNPELKQAKNLNLKTLLRSVMILEIQS